MVIKTQIVEDEGKIYVNRTQDIEPVLQKMRYKWLLVGLQMALRGEIPNSCRKWASETGLKLGSAEFLEYCKKKLKDPDFKKLIIRGL